MLAFLNNEGARTKIKENKINQRAMAKPKFSCSVMELRAEARCNVRHGNKSCDFSSYLYFQLRLSCNLHMDAVV